MSLVFLKNGLLSASFFFMFVSSIQLTVNVQYKFFPMTGFEPRTSGIGNDRSTNWATTTARDVVVKLVFGLFNDHLEMMGLDLWCTFSREKFIEPFDSKFHRKLPLLYLLLHLCIYFSFYLSFSAVFFLSIFVYHSLFLFQSNIILSFLLCQSYLYLSLHHLYFIFFVNFLTTSFVNSYIEVLIFDLTIHWL